MQSIRRSQSAVRVRAVVALLPLFIAIGCSSGPAVKFELSSGLAPFMEALRFLPPGHESYIFDSTNSQLFGRTRCNPEAFPELTNVGDWDLHSPPLRASAGSDFQHPKSSLGQGRYTGIDVIDLRREMSDREEAEWLRAQGEGLVAATVSGYKLYWSRRFAREPLDSLVTIIGGRFIIFASSLSEMERALERSSSVEQLVHEFPPLAIVPPDADCIVCRRPLPVPSDKTPRFEVDQLVVITLCIQPPGWRVFYRERLTNERSDFEFLDADITKKIPVPIEGWRSMVGIPTDPRYFLDWMYREALFGVVGVLGVLSK